MTDATQPMRRPGGARTSAPSSPAEEAGSRKRGPRAMRGAKAPVAGRSRGVQRRIRDLSDLLVQRSKMDWVQLVGSGVPARVVGEAALRFGVDRKLFLSILGVSKPTLNRLAKARGHLDVVKSDVFKDAAQVLEKILAAHGGDPGLMRRWLEGFVPALGARPIDLLGTRDGRELVAATIDRAQGGVFA